MVQPPRSDPHHRLPLPSRVFSTKFSQFPHSSNLLAIGLQSSITIGQAAFPEEDSQQTEFQWTVLKEVHHDTRVQSLEWSPRTNLLMAPKRLEFASSGTDHKVRVFTSDLNEVQVAELKGHTDYVNSLAYEPERGEQLMTGSDDHTVRVWEAGACTATLHFPAPVLSLVWHQEEPGKVLVGEKTGRISLYNATTLQPILSLDAASSPLLDLDWSPANSLLVSAAVAGELVMFDLSCPSLLLSRTVHSEGARHVAAARHTDLLVATAGNPGNCVKVWHSKSSVLLLSTELVVVGGFSWHARLPFLAVGGDREVQLFRIPY